MAVANLPADSRSIALAVMLAISLAGCAQPEAPSTDDMNTTSHVMAYFKDAHGLCYADVQSLTYAGNEVVSIANVPCDKVGL